MPSLIKLSPLALVLTLASCGGDADRAYRPDVTEVGAPSWTVVDFHVMTAEVGSEADMYAGYWATLEALLPEPDHTRHPELGIGPGEAHAGPYDGELADYISAAGLREDDVFTRAEQSEGNGVFLAFLLVPGDGAPTGSSPDFASGPILPHTVFPISVQADLYVDSAEAGSRVAFAVPALDTIDPPFAVDGHSHIPLFFSTWLNPGVESEGAYEWRVKVTDATGAGWTIVAPWTLTKA